MMDIRTVVSLFEIALGAGVLLLLVLIFSSMYRTLGDFLRALTCPDYYALNSIFLRGKRLRYVTDFPNDLRRACLVKDTYYADKPGDKARERKTKLLVQRVLANNTIINEYFREQYFTYKDFLEVKELCDLPEYDETSELLDELSSHLKEPKSAVVMKELMIEVMTDDLVEFKAGKREAALLKALNKSECTKVPWEQKDFVAFMIKLGINSGEFKGVKESTVGTYSTEIQKNMDIELCEYSVHLQKLIDKRIRQFLEKQ